MKYNFGLKVKKQNIRLLDHNAQSMHYVQLCI